MRVLSAVILVFLMTLSAPAVNIMRGNQEIGVQGHIDFDTQDDALVDVTGSLGQFWADFFLAGGYLGLTTSDSFTRWNLGGFSEYHFFLNSPLVPFIGMSAGVAGTDIDRAEPEDSEDETGFVAGLSVGAKYFLSESVAFAPVINVDWASADIFPGEDELEDLNWDIEFGLRFYF